LNSGKLTFFLLSFVNRIRNYVQDDVMREAKFILSVTYTGWLKNWHICVRLITS